ncbi:hypothetical protein PAAG_08535 [Paracoccidioides lutzii Pb01]|uniref:Acid phosphatase n=1 Tax=Paracoccidioides lutzii (strain ATCC MYA-826 / Pb01) TaxID=502779 RepID=C1HCP4_PARBA|nr:hypothetical protein PAAG_08535 [Paracoccidioides lutzii Pb01]EEH38808.2 hypothetical protein PAAG_08535 [Paracoccidioides lutzii Pb01]
MTSLVPREPYSKEELQKLYPEGLQLQLVQVVNELPSLLAFKIPAWLHTGHIAMPQEGSHKSLRQARIYPAGVNSNGGERWRDLEERTRRWWPFGRESPFTHIAKISFPGELTDKGRRSTYALGQRLRYLYVDQLGFMPKVRPNTDDMYLRTTPIPRALESLQQTFWGMYPPDSRTANFPPPTIVVRSPAEETLYPNESNCHRFRQLARLFAQRAANKWNESEEMEYLNSLWSKWMPSNSPRIAVDSRPRLSGILDTINSSLAHGPGTRLPSEFYDPKARELADRIATDEWFAGYKESNEYRKLGIGALIGDVVDRMVHTSVHGGWHPTTNGSESKTAVKFAISGCHDTTIAAILNSLGAFDDEKWPPYTSSISIELFKAVRGPYATKPGHILEELNIPDTDNLSQKKNPSSFMSNFFGSKSSSREVTQVSENVRAAVSDLPSSPLQKHYVRLRYNDRPVRIPGCAANPRNHLPGNDTFCTLEAFKKIADKFTPIHWHEECGKNLDEGMFSKGDEPSGY